MEARRSQRTGKATRAGMWELARAAATPEATVVVEPATAVRAATDTTALQVASMVRRCRRRTWVPAAATAAESMGPLAAEPSGSWSTICLLWMEQSRRAAVTEAATAG